MVDHTTSFIYSHLVRGATVEDTLAAKVAYERVLHEYEYKVRSYHVIIQCKGSNIGSSHRC
eukprot:7607574-Ditylum_brightwellii.AAC.1